MFSEEGANRRRYEGVVYGAFCRYLLEVTSKSSNKLISQLRKAISQLSLALFQVKAGFTTFHIHYV